MMDRVVLRQVEDELGRRPNRVDPASQRDGPSIVPVWGLRRIVYEYNKPVI